MPNHQSQITNNNRLLGVWHYLMIIGVLGLGYWAWTLGALPWGTQQWIDAKVASGPSQVRVLTWNIQNFGASKDAFEMGFIADLVRDYDLVTIQEVSTGPAGAQAVARLADALSRRGSQWDYVISNPTSGDASERYAFLWKPSRIRRTGRPWLEPVLADPVEREPFLMRFRQHGKPLLVASFHAVPSRRSPHREVILLARIHDLYPDDVVVILGDFNLRYDHSAFEALGKRGYVPLLQGRKTTLKQRRKNGQHLHKGLDNIFYEKEDVISAVGAPVDFTRHFRTLREARKISDHLPVEMVLMW